MRPACTKSWAAASWRHTWKVCSSSTASAAMAAWKNARRPRVMRPAAASDTSRITPRPERTPPLACISITIAITSTTTPAVTWIVRLGSRRRAGIEQQRARRRCRRASVGTTDAGDWMPESARTG